MTVTFLTFLTFLTFDVISFYSYHVLFILMSIWSLKLGEIKLLQSSVKNPKCTVYISFSTIAIWEVLPCIYVISLLELTYKWTTWWQRILMMRFIIKVVRFIYLVIQCHLKVSKSKIRSWKNKMSTQTMFKSRIDTRGSICVPKSIQEAGYPKGQEVLVILKKAKKRRRLQPEKLQEK